MTSSHGPLNGVLAKPRRGLSLVEVVISTLLVGVLLVGSMNMVASAFRSWQSDADRVDGHALANELMGEILQAFYEDQEEATTALGCEPSEPGSSRAAFDDVDDFDGWSSSPPAGRDGTPLTNSMGWKRTVQVEWVDPSDLGEVSAAETGVKRVTVTAEYGGVPQASLVALRTADP